MEESIEQGTIYFTEIPKYKVLSEKKGEEMTKSNFDKSLILKDLIEKEWERNYKNGLGELQFAFVGFMLGESMTCFEHWKKLVIVCCSSEDLCRTEVGFYLDFIKVFYGQLKQLPGDFFTEASTSGSFIKVSLQNLNEFLMDSATNPKLKQRADKFFKLIKSQFKFEASREADLQNYALGNLEGDEDMPQIVNLSEPLINLH
eukprot:TRINITY_DN7006_c0_g1_i6.p1 TRINITY_DN7006_c0_g1~~TRINITY_DN7006_c0_g1_i6.p1  ORF type:complete len:202 (-),score=72.11 TRINITY_DN7006_c0_g1_i6:120-725(-)